MKYNVNTGIKNAKRKISALAIGLIALSFPAILALSGGGASAATTYSVSPWVYDPANACPGITSSWDNSIGNPPPSLHLTKPCTTPTNAASGATINGVSGITLTELNFDYLTAGHCGAGAPRYNVVTTDNVTHFFGCIYGVHTDLGNGWTHVVFSPADAFPAVVPGEQVQSIDVVFDEGTDTIGQGTPGSTYLDNFSVNGQIVNNATPITKDDCKNNGWKSLVDANGNTFKNQGDCVSYVATKGKNRAAGPPAPITTQSPFAAGNVTLSNPTQTLSFLVNDNGASATDTGTVTYSNPGATLSYSTTPTCVNVVGNTAYFSYVIPSGNAYSGTPVVWQVVDNSPDTAGFAVAPNSATAISWCESGSFSPTNYQITSGNIIVQ